MCREGLRMIVLVSLIGLRRLLVPTIYRMVHPYISIHSVVYTLVDIGLHL